jgi:hypothetical protein
MKQLRQNSPFAGFLPAAKVWEVNAGFRQATAAQQTLTL